MSLLPWQFKTTDEAEMQRTRKMKRPWPSPCTGVWQGVEPVVADPEM